MRMVTVCIWLVTEFFLEDGVIGAYRCQNGIALDEDKSIFNAYISKGWPWSGDLVR